MQNVEVKSKLVPVPYKIVTWNVCVLYLVCGLAVGHVRLLL